jgi:hypothetical protein
MPQTLTTDKQVAEINELIELLPMAVADYVNEVSEGYTDEVLRKDLAKVIKHLALALATLGVIEPALDRGLID